MMHALRGALKRRLLNSPSLYEIGYAAGGDTDHDGGSTKPAGKHPAQLPRTFG